MNFNEFQPLALKTESRPERINAAPATLHAIFACAVLTSQMLDLAKKAVFYGKELDGAKFGTLLLGASKSLYFLADVATEATGPEKIADFIADRSFEDKLFAKWGGVKGINQEGVKFLQGLDASKLNVRLLHAGMGMLTESGEFLEALVKAWLAGEELDRVNASEEIGDIQWYAAIACDELGLDMAALLTTLIAKLRKRYGDKFDAEKAENRDLAAERAVLEEGIGQ